MQESAIRSVKLDSENSPTSPSRADGDVKDRAGIITRSGVARRKMTIQRTNELKRPRFFSHNRMGGLSEKA